MTDFQLYKKRNFSDFINDSILFFKVYGKDYFRNYMTISGILLLVMCGLYYFTFKDLFESVGNPSAMSNWFLSDGNILTFAILVIATIIVGIALSVLSVGQPIIYTKLIEKTGRNEFTSSELVSLIMDKAGRMIFFGFITLILFMPLIAIFLVIAVALSFLLIGIPILILGLPAIMVWHMQAFIVYLNEDAGYFESLKKGWKILFSNFWHIVGSTIVVYILVSIIQSAVSLIPYLSMMSSIITSGGQLQPTQLPPYMVLIYVISMVLGLVLLNIFYIQQTLVYYSAQESLGHIQAFSEIDNIGNNEA